MITVWSLYISCVVKETIITAVNQLRQAILEQKETISHSLIYIQRACNESIENSIQKQIDQLQSQTNNKLKIILQFFFLILTQFNTHYESMQDSIYCIKRCASAALFSHQKSLLSALYTITVLNARTLWVCFFFISSLFHLTLQWHHSLKLIQYAHWEYHSNDCHHCAHDF